MINFFESLHFVYCCLLFSPAILEWVKKCCVCRNCIPCALNHGLFGYVKCPIYELKIPAVNEFFVVEASKSAAIDTACTKQLQEKNGIKILKLSFKESVIFPVVIADKKCKIKAKILKENIPFKEFIKESTNYNWFG